MPTVVRTQAQTSYAPRGDADMPDDFTSKLFLKIVVIFEMDGLKVVEDYARLNRIPVDVCHKLLKDYGLLPRDGAHSDAER